MAEIQNGSMAELRIRGVPEETYRKVKALAALEGQTINDYLIKLVEEHVAKQDRVK
jgi:hypothetical protein